MEAGGSGQALADHGVSPNSIMAYAPTTAGRLKIFEVLRCLKTRSYLPRHRDRQVRRGMPMGMTIWISDVG